MLACDTGMNCSFSYISWDCHHQHYTFCAASSVRLLRNIQSNVLSSNSFTPPLSNVTSGFCCTIPFLKPSDSRRTPKRKPLGIGAIKKFSQHSHAPCLPTISIKTLLRTGNVKYYATAGMPNLYGMNSHILGLLRQVSKLRSL